MGKLIYPWNFKVGIQIFPVAQDILRAVPDAFANSNCVRSVWSVFVASVQAFDKPETALARGQRLQAWLLHSDTCELILFICLTKFISFLLHLLLDTKQL